MQEPKNQSTEVASGLSIPGIAVIGAGYWGKNLVRIYHQLGVLRLVCDKNEVILEQFKGLKPKIEVSLSFEEAFSRAEVRGVAIATPAETHFTIAREALLSGKHVYLEKPLVLVEEEGEELVAIAKERKLILMVGHLLQYHPAFLHLKKLVISGDLGRINYIYSHRLNLGKIRREENILWSFAPHDISMILSLAGEEPESVLSTGGNYLHKKIADVTTTHLEFPSGLKAHIFVSWLHPYKDQKMVVVGERRMAVFDDTQPWADKLLLYSHEIKWQNYVPIAAKAKPEHVEAIPEKEPLLLECEHFLRCIDKGEPPRTDGEEGLRVLRVLKASQRSLDENGKKICLRSTAPENSSFFDSEIKAEPAASSAIPASPPSYIHPTAIVDKNVMIGAGCRIWHFSHILSDSKIGEGCNIGQNVVIGPGVIVGKECKIQNNVSIYKGVTLEDKVFCGPSMVFTNVYNPRAEIRKMNEARATRVRRGATIGANASLICGITIGEYAFIGAGSVVTRDVPDYALVYGNPGKVKGWVCQCAEKISFQSGNGICKICGKRYKRIKGKVQLLEEKKGK